MFGDTKFLSFFLLSHSPYSRNIRNPGFNLSKIYVSRAPRADSGVHATCEGCGRARGLSRSRNFALFSLASFATRTNRAPHVFTGICATRGCPSMARSGARLGMCVSRMGEAKVAKKPHFFRLSHALRGFCAVPSWNKQSHLLPRATRVRSTVSCAWFFSDSVIARNSLMRLPFPCEKMGVRTSCRKLARVS